MKDSERLKSQRREFQVHYQHPVGSQGSSELSFFCLNPWPLKIHSEKTPRDQILLRPTERLILHHHMSLYNEVLLAISTLGCSERIGLARWR